MTNLRTFNAINEAITPGTLAFAEVWYVKSCNATWQLRFDGTGPIVLNDLNDETHSQIGRVSLHDDQCHTERDRKVLLERFYHLFQGEIWSPNGEARNVIEAAQDVWHTSLSVGDVVVFRLGAGYSFTYVCSPCGWRLASYEQGGIVTAA